MRRIPPTLPGRRVPKVIARTSENVYNKKLDFEYKNGNLILKNDDTRFIIGRTFSKHNNDKIETLMFDFTKLKKTGKTNNPVYGEFVDLVSSILDRYFGLKMDNKSIEAIAKDIILENKTNPPIEIEEVEDTNIEYIDPELIAEALSLKDNEEHIQYFIDTVGLKVRQQKHTIPFRTLLHFNVLTDRLGQSNQLHPIGSGDSSGGKTWLENTIYDLTPLHQINTFGRDYTLAYISWEVEENGKYYMFRKYNLLKDLGNASEHDDKNPVTQMWKMLKSENKFNRGIRDHENGCNVRLEIEGAGQIVSEETEIVGEEQDDNRSIRWTPRYDTNTKEQIQQDVDDEIESMKREREYQQRKPLCKAIIESGFLMLSAFETAVEGMGADYEVRVPTPINNKLREIFKAYRYSNGLRAMDHPKAILRGMALENILNRPLYYNKEHNMFIITPTLTDFKIMLNYSYDNIYTSLHKSQADINNKLEDLTVFQVEKDIDVWYNDELSDTEMSYEGLFNNYFTVDDWIKFFEKGDDESSKKALRRTFKTLSDQGYIKTFSSKGMPHKYIILEKIEDIAPKRPNYKLDGIEEEMKEFEKQLMEAGYEPYSIDRLV